MEEITVRSIVDAWLRKAGADGLFNDVCECGCPVGGLMPCHSPNDGCVPAKKIRCQTCGEEIYMPVSDAWQINANGRL